MVRHSEHNPCCVISWFLELHLINLLWPYQTKTIWTEFFVECNFCSRSTISANWMRCLFFFCKIHEKVYDQNIYHWNTKLNKYSYSSFSFRVVNEGQGSFAMGFQQIFVRFLGFIPAPVLFGALIDKSCNLWQEDACTGETTSCLEYDQPFFRYVDAFVLVVHPDYTFFFSFPSGGLSGLSFG